MRPTYGPVTGTVLRWLPEQGWGVLVSPAVDGHVFVHFSMIRDLPGARNIDDGQTVWFTWERFAQDGCPYRAVDVYTSPELETIEPAQQPPGDAYGSRLTIELDDPTQAGT